MGRHQDAIHLIWATTDLGLLTAVLLIDNAMISPLITGYPLLVAGSGLWFRVPLIWATTAMAVICYSILAMAGGFAQGRRYPRGTPCAAYHFMCMVTLGVLGVVIVAAGEADTDHPESIAGRDRGPRDASSLHWRFPRGMAENGAHAGERGPRRASC